MDEAVKETLSLEEQIAINHYSGFEKLSCQYRELVKEKFVEHLERAGVFSSNWEFNRRSADGIFWLQQTDKDVCEKWREVRSLYPNESFLSSVEIGCGVKLIGYHSIPGPVVRIELDHTYTQYGPDDVRKYEMPDQDMKKLVERYKLKIDFTEYGKELMKQIERARAMGWNGHLYHTDSVKVDLRGEPTVIALVQ